MAHKYIKAAKNLATALLSTLLVIGMAAGCATTSQAPEKHPFVEMMGELDLSIGRSVSIWRYEDPQAGTYAVPSTKYETLLSILRGIKSEQCIPVPDEWSGFNYYEMKIQQVGSIWHFQCFPEEENVIYVRFLEQGWFNYYKENGAYPFFPEMGKNWLKVQSAPLYHFIVDGMEAYLSGDVVDKDVPAEVIEKAEEIMQRELTKISAREEYKTGRWEFCSKMMGLSQLNTGVAGLEFSVNVYQLDYSTQAKSSHSSTSAGGIRYLVYLYPDTIRGSEAIFLSELNAFDLIERYGTPEMLAKYGDMYVAAAIELYNEWKETGLYHGKSDDIKTEIYDKMLNTIDHFNSVVLTMETSMLSDVIATVEYQVDINSAMAYQAVTEGGQLINETFSEPGNMILVSNNDKTYTQNYLPTYTRDDTPYIPLASRITVGSDGIPSYRYRRNVTNCPLASYCILPQELAFSYLKDFDKWIISDENINYLGRNCIKIVGTPSPYTAAKHSSDSFEMIVDSSTGVLMSFTETLNGTLSRYMKVISCTFDEHTAVNQFKPGNYNSYTEKHRY